MAITAGSAAAVIVSEPSVIILTATITNACGHQFQRGTVMIRQRAGQYAPPTARPGDNCICDLSQFGGAYTDFSVAGARAAGVAI